MPQHSLGTILPVNLFGEDVGSMVGPSVGKNLGLGVGIGVRSRVIARTTTTPITVTLINSSFWITAEKASFFRELDTCLMNVSSTKAGSSSSGVYLYSSVVIIMYLKIASFLVVLL